MTKNVFGAADPSDQFLYMPARAGAAAMGEFKRRNSTKIKFVWGLGELDEYLTPMVQGDLVAIIGRPGHAKTSVMIHLSRQANQVLYEHGDNQYVLYATWETLVEEFVAIQRANISGTTLSQIGRGRADLDKLGSAIARTIAERVAVIGKSMERIEGFKRSMPTLHEVDEILTSMRLSGHPASIMLADYLQRIPGAPGRDRQMTVSENLEALKDIALDQLLPVVVGVQAKREVDDYKIKLPNLSDGQWTSNIEQTCDKVLGVSRPILYQQKGTAIEIEGNAYEVTDELFLLRVLKQRWGPAGKTFVLNLDPTTCSLSESDPLEAAF